MKIIEIEQIDEYSDNHVDITKILRTKGYKKLGQGVDQMAFLEPSTGQVLKIFGTQVNTRGSGGKTFSRDQKMFFTWAKYCKANKKNPFLPKYSDFTNFVFDDHTYLQIRMERLQEIGKLGRNCATAALFVERNLNFYDIDHITAAYIDKYLKKRLGKNLDLFIRTIYQVYKMAEDYGWAKDLHHNNFMKRGNTPVIVDPWVA